MLPSLVAPAGRVGAQYLTKGKQVYVEGRLQTRSYEDKDGKKVYATDVVADEVILLGGRGGEEPAPAPRAKFVPPPDEDEDAPF